MRQIPHTSDNGKVVIFVIDIVLENGARGRNRTFLKYHLIIVSYKLLKIWNWSTKRSLNYRFTQFLDIFDRTQASMNRTPSMPSSILG